MKQLKSIHQKVSEHQRTTRKTNFVKQNKFRRSKTRTLKNNRAQHGNRKMSLINR